ncbi:hypothetical protein N9N55_07720 [Opitutales bacterium]|nr:hypothetical protein [Opitutales bacterium]
MKFVRLLCLAVFSVFGTVSHGAIDIIFDYSYDTSNYFGDEQRYVMEQVAYAFESRMGGTTFTGTRAVEDVGVSGVTPKLYFKNPTTNNIISPLIGSSTADGNVIGKPNELVVFLGARSHGFSSSNVLASAAQTGHSYSYTSLSDRDAWLAARNAKDTSSLYQPIAGVSQVNTSKSFYFDTDLTSHSDATSSGLVDFYSVMVHEIGHIMGFNSNNAFTNFSSGGSAGSGSWTGANAKAEYNNQNVPLNGNPHWGNSLTQGNVNCACHPSMQPSISSNKRTSFSALDFALLKDVGYTISATPTGTNIGGTYTDPDWGGSYYIPVSETYADWLGGGGGGAGGGGGVGGSAAPEPAYIFTLLGGALAFLGGRKNLQKIKAIFRFA